MTAAAFPSVDPDTEQHITRPVGPPPAAYVRAAGILVGVSLVAGLVQAWLWATLAPGVQYQVYPQQAWASLPTETQHHFVAFAVFALIGLMFGVATAASAWQFRRLRGAVLLVVTGVGATLGSVLAWFVAPSWASGTDPAVVAQTPGVQTIVTAPAVLTREPLVHWWSAFGDASFWGEIVAAPVAAVLVYTLLVAWNGLPDLGRTAPYA